jgi:hypothetical protein
MKYSVQNHLNTSTYDSFVPAVTKKSNAEILKVIVGLAAVGLLIWLITSPGKEVSQKDEKRS